VTFLITALYKYSYLLTYLFKIINNTYLLTYWLVSCW